jgi:hypothetical protein
MRANQRIVSTSLPIGRVDPQIFARVAHGLVLQLREVGGLLRASGLRGNAQRGAGNEYQYERRWLGHRRYRRGKISAQSRGPAALGRSSA